MATKVLVYSQLTDPMHWAAPSADMPQGDRQESYSNGAYAWVNPLTYLQIPDNSAGFHSDPHNLSSVYDPSYESGSQHCSPSNYPHDPSRITEPGSTNLSWVDVPLDPNAIYHMPLHGSGWSGTVEVESPYERDRTVIRQVWEQRIRDHWFRRNGITASPTDTQYDRLIPEFRAGEYAERYFGSMEAQINLLGKQDENVHLPYPHCHTTERSTSSATIDSSPGTSVPGYASAAFGHHMSQEHGPSTDRMLTIPPPVTSAHALGPQLLQPPYRDHSAPLSPTDAGSPSGLYPNAYSSQISTSPRTALSALGSDAAESPLSEIRETRSTSPAGSTSAISTSAEEPSSSKTATHPDAAPRAPKIMRSRSLEGNITGQPGMGPVRRGTSASDRGRNAAGNIRVHRPAGIKWNQRTRCAYINPVTGLQCRTSAGRGPDLERHLRTVHLREEARAVSDGLIPRDKAELLPPDWVMGDRLDFDCPHCAVRFTREDARDRHVKVQHQVRHYSFVPRTPNTASVTSG